MPTYLCRKLFVYPYLPQYVLYFLHYYFSCKSCNSICGRDLFGTDFDTPVNVVARPDTVCKVHSWKHYFTTGESWVSIEPPCFCKRGRTHIIFISCRNRTRPVTKTAKDTGGIFINFFCSLLRHQVNFRICVFNIEPWFY